MDTQMLPLSPPPPFPLPPPPSQKQAISSPLKQIFSTSRQVENQHLLPPEVPNSYKIRPTERPKLIRLRRTNPIIWFASVLCLIFSLLLIFFGIATLIIFVGIKPRKPVFDTPSASLSVVYINSPTTFLNGDLSFVANFTNPNHKLEVSFEYLELELYFLNNLIAAQALQPFTQKREETRLVPIHMISSLVYLPPNHALELQKLVQSNRVIYHLKGTFRVRINFGIVHISYRLHSRCQLELTGPPTGVLIAHSCSTKR